MQEGFIVDSKHRGKTEAKWHVGAPKPQTFFLGGGDGVWVKNDLTIPISSYRCCECGFLASYARKREKP